MINKILNYKNNICYPGNSQFAAGFKPAPFFKTAQMPADTVSFGSAAALTPKKIADFADGISGEILKEHLFKIASPETRGRAVGSKGIEIAKDYIAGQFAKLNLEPVEKLGLDDFFQKFKTNKYKTGFFKEGEYHEGHVFGSKKNPLVETSNVLGMIKGSENPDDYLILTAHYDHLGQIGKGAMVFPGADDNASGVSALLEIARVMKKEGNNKKSVIFAALSGEESGLYGAKNLASSLKASGIAKNTEVVNVEMLGATGGETLDLWAEELTLSQKLITGFKRACRALKIRTNIQQGSPSCDAVAFDIKKIPAVTTSWDYSTPSSHPFYHTTADTPEKVNMTAFEKAVKTISAACYVLANKVNRPSSVVSSLKRLVKADSFAKTKVA